MFLAAPLGLVTPELAHHLEKMLHEEAARARRGGYVLPDCVVDHLATVRKLAAAYRAQVTDANDGNVSFASDVPAPRSTMSVQDLSGAAGVSDHGVREAARRGRLTGQRVGGRWRFDETDALAWLSSRNGAATMSDETETRSLPTLPERDPLGPGGHALAALDAAQLGDYFTKGRDDALRGAAQLVRKHNGLETGQLPDSA